MRDLVQLLFIKEAALTFLPQKKTLKQLKVEEEFSQVKKSYQHQSFQSKIMLINWVI